MAERLTDNLVRDLPAPEKGHRLTYDLAARGLGVRVTAARRHTYVFRYRVKGTRIERLHTVGDAGHWRTGRWEPGAWTIKKARDEAEKLRREVDGGGDPMGDLHAARAAPTVADLADRFIAEHLPRKRPSTQDEYRRLLRVHILPALGNKRVADLRHGDGEAMHRKIAATAPYAANRALAVASKMLSLAVRWEYRPDHPFRAIERSPEQRRERFLTPAEIARLGGVLATHPERTSANAVRLLLLTGARKGETLAARWPDIDLASGAWSKPAATTKTAKLHRVPLSAPALQLLSGMKAEADQENARRARDGLPRIDHVFPSVNEKPLHDIKHFWAAVSRKADLQGVRVHDLRHTFASILASSGLSLPIIGALLGHTQAATTQRYSHLMDDPLRAATERAGAVIAGAGKPAAEVVTMAGRRA